MALKNVFATNSVRGLSHIVIRQFAQAAACPSVMTYRDKFDQSDRDPNWQTMAHCKVVPPNCSPRADALYGPIKNHKKPYQEPFCDPEPPPIRVFRFKREECCYDFGPRRPRKVPNNKKGNSLCDAKVAAGKGINSSECPNPPVTCIGCRPARVPNACFDVRDPEFCDRIVTPTLSFHECVKKTIKDLPPDECSCHVDQQPPCKPTKRKNVIADR